MNFFLRNSKKTDCQSNFDIDFFKELSTGALIFKIIDNHHNIAGHVITCGSDIKILESSLYSYTTYERKYLRSQVQAFLNAVE